MKVFVRFSNEYITFGKQPVYLYSNFMRNIILKDLYHQRNFFEFMNMINGFYERLYKVYDMYVHDNCIKVCLEMIENSKKLFNWIIFKLRH